MKSEEVRPLINKPTGSSKSRTSTPGEEEHHEHHHSHEGLQTIGLFGSTALLINNLTGPAMMEFPHLFQQAGVLPVVFTIIFVYLSASLCSTFLAESISSIENNSHFQKQIDFSAAFHILVGNDWYVVAEIFFFLACYVQACTAIVEASQSIDGFIASFVFGKTYALQIIPSLEFISWSSANCHEGSDMYEESTLEECTPFHNDGTLIITLGFLLTTVLLLPLGMGHLKETINVQIFSFLGLLILCGVFFFEFFHLGNDNEIPWVGKEITPTAGIVLFNYAFSITVPAWLMEKSPSVSVNKTVWTSTTFSSILYILFGIIGAKAFDRVGSNILVLLASTKVHLMTRICAALFGFIIIGCGVPVICVILRTALVANKLCSKSAATFFGAVCPYLLCWMLYQGSMLIAVLNWAGLIVNGVVAFILPMVLALRALQLRDAKKQIVEENTQEIQNMPSTIHIPTSGEPTSPFATYHKQQEQELELPMLSPLTSTTVSLPPSTGKTASSIYYAMGQATPDKDLSIGSMSFYVSETESEIGRGSPPILMPDEGTDSGDGQPPLDNGNRQGDGYGSTKYSKNNNTNMSKYGLVLSPTIEEHPEEGFSSSSQSHRSSEYFDDSSDEVDFTHPAAITTSSEVQPLPPWLNGYRRIIVVFIIVTYTAIIVGTILEDAIYKIAPPEEK